MWLFLGYKKLQTEICLAKVKVNGKECEPLNFVQSDVNICFSLQNYTLPTVTSVYEMAQTHAWWICRVPLHIKCVWGNRGNLWWDTWAGARGADLTHLTGFSLWVSAGESHMTWGSCTLLLLETCTAPLDSLQSRLSWAKDWPQLELLIHYRRQQWGSSPKNSKEIVIF